MPYKILQTSWHNISYIHHIYHTAILLLGSSWNIPAFVFKFVCDSLGLSTDCHFWILQTTHGHLIRGSGKTVQRKNTVIVELLRILRFKFFPEKMYLPPNCILVYYLQSSRIKAETGALPLTQFVLKPDFCLISNMTLKLCCIKLYLIKQRLAVVAKIN